MKVTRKTEILILFVMSALIYLLQILFFHDPHNTFFYLFQDMAFLPVSIAIATIAVGAILDRREKREKLQGTRMLRSTFFTGIGAEIILKLHDCADPICRNLLYSPADEAEVKTKQEQIRETEFTITLTEEAYESVWKILTENQTNLFVLAANENLMAEENFTKLLWGLFHLIDEFRLRGSWQNQNEADREHLNEDFAKVYRLLLINSVDNAWWLKKTYPNFYGTASSKYSLEKGTGGNRGNQNGLR